MIFAIGLDTDKTYLTFLRRATEAGVDVQAINLRAVAAEPWHLSVPAGAGASRVYWSEEPIDLDPSASYFVRAIDLSPALDAASAARWRGMLAGLAAYLETVPGRCINRPGNHAHNAAKPLHAWWLAQHGLDVPPSLTSSRAESLLGFVRRHGTCVVKALSGTRGITRIVGPDELERFEPERGPIHIQQVIEGYDVRAHVVGDRVFAEKITSPVTDYRAAPAESRHEVTELPPALTGKLVAATRALGLVFAGWDFKVGADGIYWCLEANPMPGYDVYDRRAGGAISFALIDYLHGSP